MDLSDDQLLAIANGEPSQAAAPAASAAEPSGFANFANAAGNAATAASQGLLQGTRNFQIGTGLLLRDITDSLGFTDPSTSHQIRQGLENDQNITHAAGQKLGHPVLSKAGEVVGEVAPNLLIGNEVFQGARSLLGAGRLADVGASTVTGAASGLLSNPGDSGLSGRVDQAIDGAKWGAVLGASFNGFGAAKDKLIGLKTDPRKLEAFKTAGIPVTASQAADETLSPRVQSFYQNIEADLGKLPGFGVGLSKKLGQQPGKFQEYSQKVVSELEQSYPAPNQAFATIHKIQESTGIHDVRPITNIAKEGFDSLDKVIAAKVSPATKQILQNVAGIKPSSFSDLHSLRQELDDQLSTMSTSLGEKATRMEFRALKNVRKAVSTRLGQIAEETGIGDMWKQANTAYENSLYAKAASDAFYGAYANQAGTAVKAGDVQGMFDTKRFVTLWNKMRTQMGEQRLAAPEGMSKAIDNVELIGNTLAKSWKTGGKGILLKTLAGTGLTAGAIGYGLHATDNDAGALAAGAGLLTGAGLMLSTRTGISLLSKFDGLHSPGARMALSVMAGLGKAKHTKDQMDFQHERDKYLATVPEEQLLSIANAGGQ